MATSMSYWKLFLSKDEGGGEAESPTPEPSTHDIQGFGPRQPQAQEPSDTAPASSDDTPASSDDMPPDEPSTITKSMGTSSREDSE